MKQFLTAKETLDVLVEELRKDRKEAARAKVGWLPSNYHSALYRLAALQVDHALEIGSLDWEQFDRLEEFEKDEPWTKGIPR